jgi:hypothetical protein
MNVEEADGVATKKVPEPPQANDVLESSPRTRSPSSRCATRASAAQR